MSIIKAMNLKKYYITDTYEVRALDGVSLVVEEREFIAVVGTSGCGKTTLMNILGGLDVPDSGALWIKNTSLKDLSKEQRTIFRRRNIGFVFQQYNLIPSLNIRENIVLPLRLWQYLDYKISWIVFLRLYQEASNRELRLLEHY